MEKKISVPHSNSSIHLPHVNQMDRAIMEQVIKGHVLSGSVEDLKKFSILIMFTVNMPILFIDNFCIKMNYNENY